ncbi:MAG: LON peptidase substrate-binding domain-containing protein [Solirubrobacterales bacterium]
MDRTSNYPLFLLGTVLLPSEQTMLRVFEERYRDLAARCVENDEPFGFVMIEDSGAPSEYGCATRITEVVKRYDDGQLDVLVTGEAPIRLVELEQLFTYPSAIVEAVADAPEEPGDAEQATRTRTAFLRLIDALGVELPDELKPDRLGSYEMAALLDLNRHDKQALLELRDEGDRMSLLEKIFGDAATTAAATRKLSDIAQSNGHGRKH